LRGSRDFACILAALDTATGWKTLPAYRVKVEALGMSIIEGDTLARSLYYLADRASAEPDTPAWDGTAGELLPILRQIAVAHNLPANEIPGDIRVIGRRVREVAASLRKIGIDVRFRKSGSKRYLRIVKLGPAWPTGHRRRVSGSWCWSYGVDLLSGTSRATRQTGRLTPD
ncbi:MAG: hypothetical protein ACRDRL_12815, partial [Sciscionella sp.]